MLVEFKVQNFSSFNAQQTLSMLASSSTKENYNEKNTFPVNKFGINNLLKSAAVFGANASGKSNLINAFSVFREIVLESITTADSDNLSTATPFLLKTEPFEIPVEFEITFIFDGNIYRYGLAFVEEKISEEWLYWTKTSRETMLFYRIGQNVEFNKRSFSEAKDFVRSDGDSYTLEKTRENVPFLSVLAQFNGTKSRNVIRWFKKLKIYSGTNSFGEMNVNFAKSNTISLFEENPAFKEWALKILSALQIQDIKITEIENQPNNLDESLDTDFKEAMTKLNKWILKKQPKRKKIEIVKSPGKSGNLFVFPLSFESEGTQKLISLLGPIFEAVMNGETIVIDEFDNKFHSLLSLYILDLYHQFNNSFSQLLITCHDTNLLTNDLFRRDQIWFLEKNKDQESELYSLLEYKEHYTRKGNSYSKDYLNGKYGAVPLLKSIDDLSEIFDGK